MHFLWLGGFYEIPEILQRDLQKLKNKARETISYACVYYLHSLLQYFDGRGDGSFCDSCKAESQLVDCFSFD
jgi:hypothetical protein